MPLFRPHKGSLSDSMKEVVNVKDKQALLNKVIHDLWEFNYEGVISKDTLQVKYYCSDYRIDWNTTYIVTLEGYGVLGFTNGDLI